MSEVAILAGLASIVALAILYGRARAHAADDATLDAAQGRAAEAEARVKAQADAAVRSAEAREVAGEIDHAAANHPAGADRIGARWDKLRELHEDEGGGPPRPGDDPP